MGKNWHKSISYLMKVPSPKYESRIQSFSKNS